MRILVLASPTHNTRPSLGQSRVALSSLYRERSHMRFEIADVGWPASGFKNTRELVSAFRDAMCGTLYLFSVLSLSSIRCSGHKQAWEGGVLYRDVSIGKLLIVDNPLGNLYSGFFHDFDYGSIKEDIPEGDLPPSHESDDDDDDDAVFDAMVALQQSQRVPLQKVPTVVELLGLLITLDADLCTSREHTTLWLWDCSRAQRLGSCTNLAMTLNRSTGSCYGSLFAIPYIRWAQISVRPSSQTAMTTRPLT